MENNNFKIEVELWDMVQVYVPLTDIKYDVILNHYYEGHEEEVKRYDIQIGDKCKCQFGLDLVVEGEIVNKKQITKRKAKKNADTLYVLYLISNSKDAIIHFNETLADHICSEEYLWLLLKTEDGDLYECAADSKDFIGNNRISVGDKLRFLDDEGMEIVGEVLAGHQNRDKQFVRRDECYWAKPL